MNVFSKDAIQTVELDISTVCNAQCPLCMRQSAKFKKLYSKPFFRKQTEIISQLESFKNLQNVFLIGQMSEPTLHPDFLKIVEKLKQMGLNLKICTNGSTNNAEFWENLGKLLSENDRVWFAICGSSEEMHQKYRAGTILADILKNASHLRLNKKVDGAKCIRFRYNSDDFESQEFKNMVKQFSYVEYTETSILDDVSKCDSCFLPCEKIMKEYNQIDTLSRMMNKLRPGNECQSLFERYVQIDPYGNLFPCYVFLEHSENTWDFDYDKIKNGEYQFCRCCNKNVIDYIQKRGLNFIL